ncbi:MAG: YIP1 family protein [Acidobacteria bacterium]|nr:YIP1 family protein [Acidobacteriota bacterium]
MNRLAGIGLAVVGVVFVALSIMSIVPGLSQPGVPLIIAGLLIVGLSFIKAPDTEGVERTSTANTLVNLFFSPSEAFAALKRHPRWLVAILLMALMSGVYTNLFIYKMTPERIANYTIDKTLEMPMIANSEQARTQVQENRPQAIKDLADPVGRAGQFISSFAGQVILYAFLAAVFLIFALAMGGKLNFLQAFSIAVYAAFPVAVIRFILNTFILFLKDVDDIHPIRGQQSLVTDNLSFLVIPSDHPVIFTLLSTLSLLGIYWIWLNATGLKNGGETISGTIAWTTSLTVYGVIILFAILAAWAFPTFIS